MTITTRFAAVYPDRCFQLFDLLEQQGDTLKLDVSLIVMTAASAFVIPYERMKRSHPLREADKEPDIFDAVRTLEKEKFLKASFLDRDLNEEDWIFSRITSTVDDQVNWKDENGNHPAKQGSSNTILRRTVNDVFQVLRNALAHGNVIYLNKNGEEREAEEVHFIAFLSKYEGPGNGERVLITTPSEFRKFVRNWVKFLQLSAALAHSPADIPVTQ